MVHYSLRTGVTCWATRPEGPTAGALQAADGRSRNKSHQRARGGSARNTVRLITPTLVPSSGKPISTSAVLCSKNKRESHLKAKKVWLCRCQTQTLAPQRTPACPEGSSRSARVKENKLTERDCSGLLRNEVSLLSRAEYSFFCFYSCSNSWFWWYLPISTIFTATAHEEKHLAILNNSHYS